MNAPPTDRPSLFLLDGYALMYRAFFAMISRPLTTSSGENTSAPYGIARFLLRLREDYDPEYLGVVFDAGDSKRGELLPEYKATRERMPDELRASLVRCREIFEAFRVPVLEAQGWEADDVIGTLAKQASSAGLRTVVVSGDKDFHQLVDEHTVLLNPGRGGPAGVEQEWITLENAEERLGVPPGRVTDYLALLGDSSDNVPGVPGIGKKTAPSLIREFGDLESLLERAEEVTATRARNALIEHGDSARLSKQLVTIRTDAPATLDLESLVAEPFDYDRTLEIFRELEFHNLVRDLESTGAGGAKQVFEPECTLVTDVQGLAAALDELGSPSRVGLWVIEERGEAGPGLVGLAISGDPERAWYLSFGHRSPDIARDPDGNPTLAFDVVEAPNLPELGSGPSIEGLGRLNALLEGPVPKMGHDLKEVAQVLRRAGVVMGGLTFDTELASYCLGPAARDRRLDVLAPEKLGAELVSREAVIGEGRNRVPFAETSAEDVMTYAGPRAAVVLPLADAQDEELERVGMRALCRDVELPLIPVLASMERAGVKIDLEFFTALGERFEREIRLVREEIHKIAGEEVNLRSVPQLRTLLFETLELPIIKKTKTGPSTDESVLEELAAQGHDIPRLILEHRELDKLDGTYVSKLPRLVDADSRIHTRYHQTAVTGRLASSDPNLQNIPIRSEPGREIRKGFVPAEGFMFIGADYSQVELRVMAHLSGDEAFVEAFRADRDIHRETAARIFGVDADAVSGAMREQAKTINFATIYGQGPFALAAQLGISRDEAREFIKQYFERFSGVATYLEEMKETARTQGYVETLIGRRRYIPEIRSKNPGQRGFGERTATNSPIQGTAADIIKLAMIHLHERLASTRARMLLQVHDELLFEVPEDEVDETASLVTREMEGALELDVPLRVDVGVGASWYECKFGH